MDVNLTRPEFSAEDLLTTSCAVLTATEAGQPLGCLVASVMPVGYRSGRLALGLDDGSRTARAVRRGGALGLHVLDPDDLTTARAFASPAEDPAQRFAGIPWTPGELGVPVLTGAVAAVEALVSASHRAGPCVLVDAVVTAWHGNPAPGARGMTIFHARRAGLE
ncbi:flavin reductase [Streptomyces violaceoruber]|uniref:flavin reductase family protein n=1 Tax=Streptomyces violaceoruber TaxID=1935 RepID=UPI001F30B730|nr:flavin reductase family protein [Streptomyces violaceoruber]MCF3165793.1 flavin reductase [Streptomyces violaceoruber]